MSPDPLQHLTLPQVAELLGMSRTWVAAQIRSGDLPHIPYGPRAKRVRRDHLQAFSDARVGGGQVRLAEVIPIRPVRAA